MKYKGIEWDTKAELSRKLGKCRSYVNYCLHNGKTYEEIIDIALNKEKHYKGIRWTNKSDLSVKLGKSHSYVNYHLSIGKTYEEIIDTVLKELLRGKPLCSIEG